MPLPSSALPDPADLSPVEWDELQALRRAISVSPASVHPDKMERFTELFARTLQGKGDIIHG